MNSEGCLPRPRIARGTQGLEVGMEMWMGVTPPCPRPCALAAAASNLAARKIGERLA